MSTCAGWVSRHTSWCSIFTTSSLSQVRTSPVVMAMVIICINSDDSDDEINLIILLARAIIFWPTEIKGYAMLQFSYMMLKIYGKVELHRMICGKPTTGKPFVWNVWYLVIVHRGINLLCWAGEFHCRGAKGAWEVWTSGERENGEHQIGNCHISDHPKFRFWILTTFSGSAMYVSRLL